MKRAAFLLLALVACGTPQENCIRGATRDLRMVERLITETQANLNRGYAFEDVAQFRRVWINCTSRPIEGQSVRPRMCWETEPYTVKKPKAIDLEAEKRKLDSLQTKRHDLLLQAEGAIAQCKALHPE